MERSPAKIDLVIHNFYLITEKGMTAEAVQDLLYRESGLKGLSGISNDMRELQSNAAPAAKLAVDYFVYRIGLHAGMLAAALGGLDAFVFTAGIGERSAVIRARIAERLAWLGVVFDPVANDAGKSGDFASESRVRALRRADRRGIDDRAPDLGAVETRRRDGRRDRCRKCLIELDPDQTAGLWRGYVP